MGFVFGSILYLLGFVMWLLILKSNSLSVAFPLAASALLIGTQIVGFYLLGENLTLWKIVGIVLIVIGISLIYIEK